MVSEGTDYTAFVVFTDRTYKYGFNEGMVDNLGSAEDVALALCPRKEEPDAVMVI